MTKLVHLLCVVVFFLILLLFPSLLMIYTEDERKVPIPSTATKSEDTKSPRAKQRFLKKPTLNVEPSCPHKSCYSPNWKMVMLVKSSAKNNKRRKLIRETWGSLKYFNGIELRTVFVVGKSDPRTQRFLRVEHRTNNDMLILDKKDIYRNVVLKTLGSMQWASDELPDDYLVSTADDDVFIDLVKVKNALSSYIQEKAENFPIICMYELRQDPGPPDRWRPSKYFVSKEEYSADTYPQYCPGAMYTMSVYASQKLWIASRTVSTIPVDDVLVTGILRQKVEYPYLRLVEVRPSVVTHYEGFYGSLTPGKFRKQWNDFAVEINATNNCFC